MAGWLRFEAWEKMAFDRGGERLSVKALSRTKAADWWYGSGRTGLAAELL
jgi:hypothetical protein